MSVRKFSTASILSPSYKNSKIWDGETFPGYFESIQTVVAPSAGSASVIFNNIPQNYAHLQLRFIARGGYGISGAYSVGISYNGDTSSNYSFHNLRGNGSSASTGAGVNQSYDYSSIVQGTNLSPVTQTFAANILDILDYSNTNKFKTIKTLAGVDTNGTGDQIIILSSACWRSTSAITSITLSTVGFGSFLEYSHFALYGIRSA